MTGSVGLSTRLSVGLAATIREFVRQPINLALLVCLPPVVITSYGSILSALPETAATSTSPEAMGATAGTLFVAAFLPAVIGLFQVISARRADDRLSLSGFPRNVLFAARFLAVVLASLLTAAISIAVLTTRTEVEAVLLGGGLLVFVGVLYGLIGMLIGALLPRELEGSLVLIFLVDMDEALASGIVETDSRLTALFPLHSPHDLFQAAVEGERLASGDLVAAGVYWLVVVTAVLIVYTELTDRGGVVS